MICSDADASVFCILLLGVGIIVLPVDWPRHASLLARLFCAPSARSKKSQFHKKNPVDGMKILT